MRREAFQIIMLGVMLASIDPIIHPQRDSTSAAGTGDDPAQQVVSPLVRMGVWTHRHADTTVGADAIPVFKACFRIHAPAQPSRIFLSWAKGDGTARATLRALFTDAAKIQHRPAIKGLIHLQRKISRDHA